MTNNMITWDDLKQAKEKIFNQDDLSIEAEAERERILNGFKDGKIKVISNVGVLQVGFDYPELETIVLARPTLSLALYYQMIGRGIRPHPEKDHAMIVDLCGNYDLFGKVEDLRIDRGTHGKWSVWNKQKQLTNVYFERN